MDERFDENFENFEFKIVDNASQFGHTNSWLGGFGAVRVARRAARRHPRVEAWATSRATGLSILQDTSVTWSHNSVSWKTW